MKLTLWGAALALTAGSIPLVANADYSVTMGAEYTTGDYGLSSDTSSWYIPVTVDYAAEEYSVGITVPYLSVVGSETVTGSHSASYTVRGPGGVKTQTLATTSSATREREDSGLGDITLRFSYQLQQETEQRPWLGVTAKAKLGTADEQKYLGTGENDYALQLEVAKGPVDGLVGYHILGDTSTTNFNNILSAAVAYSVDLKNRWRMRTEFYTEQEAIDGVDGARELNLSFRRPLSRERDLNLYLIKGLSDASPDWGAGVMLRTKF